MKESQVISALGALSSEHRLKIFRHLVKAGGAGSSAGDIGRAVKAAPSKVSFHLSALERANLVSSERDSRHIIYQANFRVMGAVLNYLMQDCCQGNPAILSCCGTEQGQVRSGAKP